MQSHYSGLRNNEKDDFFSFCDDASVHSLKMSAQGLPAHILTLFGPRPPVEPLPCGHIVEQRQRVITGFADYLDEFEDDKPEERPM